VKSSKGAVKERRGLAEKKVVWLRHIKFGQGFGYAEVGKRSEERGLIALGERSLGAIFERGFFWGGKKD